MNNPLINILTRTSNRPNAFYLNKAQLEVRVIKI